MKHFPYIAAIISIIFTGLHTAGYAQQQSDTYAATATTPPYQPTQEKGLLKERIFTGGDITASFFNGGSVLGASPIIGYKLNDYVDAGAVINYVYHGSKNVYTTNDSYRKHVFGPGVFIRAYPVPFLFAQAQLEQNFTSYNYRAPVGSGHNSTRATYSAPSLLLGGGFASGRIKGSTTFFYFSVMADVLRNANSPYVSSGEGNAMLPIIRAGVNIGLFQGRNYQQYEY